MALWDWLVYPVPLTPHGYCLLWAPGLIWLHGVSDVIIGLAYFSIPLALFFTTLPHCLSSENSGVSPLALSVLPMFDNPLTQSDACAEREACGRVNKKGRNDNVLIDRRPARSSGSHRQL